MLSTVFVPVHRVCLMLLRLLLSMLRVSEGKFEQVKYSEDN